MATRMQQRRGTASQWTTANPILNAGEMGWESDTNKFKIGDGTNHWANLDYFADINSTVNPAFGTSIVFEGATADSYETTLQVTDPTADRTITLPNVDGTVITTGNLSDITDIGVFTSTIVMEGSTADAHELTLSAGDPTADRTITFPDATGTVQLRVTDVSDTEIGYLNGVTSGIQTQIDNKASLSGATFTGAVSGTSLTLSGDLTVNGTTTTLNSTTISVDDKNIELGSVATPSDATADGGGITLKGTTDKTFNWVDATDAWTSSEHINLASGKSLYLNGTLLKDATETLTNKTLTSPVINTPTGITKSDVGLANVDNTTDAGKPVSTATQTALDLKLASATAATTYETITNVALKAPLADPTFTGTVTLPSTTSIGDVSSTELSYLNNVTSAIQTQLDGKVDESLFDTKGDILVASADNTPAKLAAGTNGYLLTANSAAANGVEWAAAPVSLPTQTDNSGKYLTTDGTTASWGTLVVPITTGTSTVSANTATTIDTTALSAFTSIEYMVSLKQGSKIRTSKVVVQTDGTSVDMTEFAITETGGTIAGVVVSVAVSSTNAVLQLTATDAVTTNVTVKFSKVAL